MKLNDDGGGGGSEVEKRAWFSIFARHFSKPTTNKRTNEQTKIYRHSKNFDFINFEIGNTRTNTLCPSISENWAYFRN